MRSALAVAALAALVLGCGGPALPILGDVPAFALVDQQGKPVGVDALRGKTSIVNFIFTRCPDVCPVLTARMRDVERELGSGPVTLMSISVDPATDTPDVLQRYATEHKAGWSFLTGDREAIRSLLTGGFHVAFGDDGPATGPLTHSDRFVLVDGALRIRGYYHGNDPDDVARLVTDARALAAAG